jgi:rfaE bifunctional protein nucleotidyltransferase chain/domain
VSESKIFLDPGSLAPHIEELKRRGAKIAFANGCFELLHVGHVRYLAASRALADVLVVAVNTDESMRRIKPDRSPVNPDHERFEILAAIESVDYVVPLRDDTPDSLLLLFRPHYHCKGTDYTLERIPERGVVEGYGGEVRLVGDPKSHSTTEMLRVLRGKESAGG